MEIKGMNTHHWIKFKAASKAYCMSQKRQGPKSTDEYGDIKMYFKHLQIYLQHILAIITKKTVKRIWWNSFENMTSHINLAGDHFCQCWMVAWSQAHNRILKCDIIKFPFLHFSIFMTIFQ